ncbi:MAG: hypothetical protein JRI25_12560 [Deltaproteobacteria bacterium]|nr:hypothetical protein [Deltaproteobacteria bacterium]
MGSSSGKTVHLSPDVHGAGNDLAWELIEEHVPESEPWRDAHDALLGYVADNEDRMGREVSTTGDTPTPFEDCLRRKPPVFSHFSAGIAFAGARGRRCRCATDPPSSSRGQREASVEH